jgi:hypothetical protein
LFRQRKEGEDLVKKFKSSVEDEPSEPTEDCRSSDEEASKSKSKELKEEKEELMLMFLGAFSTGQHWEEFIVSKLWWSLWLSSLC